MIWKLFNHHITLPSTYDLINYTCFPFLRWKPIVWIKDENIDRCCRCRIKGQQQVKDLLCSWISRGISTGQLMKLIVNHGEQFIEEQYQWNIELFHALVVYWFRMGSINQGLFVVLWKEVVEICSILSCADPRICKFLSRGNVELFIQYVFDHKKVYQIQNSEIIW